MKNTEKSLSKENSLEKLEEIFKKIEEKTKLPRKKIFIILGTSFTLIWFRIFDIYISYVLTIYFPVIWSLKVIDNKETENFKQWLAYWIFFSLFVLIDMMSAIIIKIIPFYFIIRTIVLLWMSLPSIKGALKVYDLLIVQLLKLSRTIELFRNINKRDSLKLEVETIIEDRNIEKEILFEPTPSGINPSINSKGLSFINNITDVQSSPNISHKKNN
jgi:hypothetical protein